MGMVLTVAALTWGAAAMAQAQVPPPTGDGVEVASRGAATARPQPSAEAMKLGRRIAYALHQEDLSKGVHTLIALVEEEKQQTAATPPVRPDPFTAPAFSDWADLLYDRAVEHVALAYARRYSEAELAQIAGFFGSPTGEKFVRGRYFISHEFEVAFRSRAFEEEFIALACRPPSGPVDAALKRTGWCDDQARADPHVGRSVAKAVERFGPPIEVIDYQEHGRFFTFSRRAYQIMMNRDAANPRNWTKPTTRLDEPPAPVDEDHRSLPPMSFSPPRAPASCTLTLVADWDEGRKAWIAKRAIRGEAEGGRRCITDVGEE